GEGVLRCAVGNYDYYLEKRAAEAVLRRPAVSAASPNELAKPSPPPRKLKWKEERELEGMEAAILAAEAAVVRLEEALDSVEPARSAAEYAGLGVALEAAQGQVARLYERWAELGAIAASG
ncbi:MAG: ABC transporter ATP-binding protein, partial [Verrucomicrobiota bacterium]|nr:ABC transporter ATP-binding protein [Verrucomicrobiota bacterium]